MTKGFNVTFLKEADEFLDGLDDKARYKVIYNIHKAQFTSDPELFKKLEGEIWEFRTRYNKLYYRLFAFWDKTEKTNVVVISTNGLIKKTGKTPQKELEKAERLRKLYFQQKTTAK
jgi:phage-related protein